MRLSEFSSPKQYSRNSIPPVSQSALCPASAKHEEEVVVCSLWIWFSVGGTALATDEDGIDLDPRDNFGRTPLMEAVRHENEPCARLLTARGAFHGFVEDLNLATANSVIAGQELCQATFSGKCTNHVSIYTCHDDDDDDSR